MPVARTRAGSTSARPWARLALMTALSVIVVGLLPMPSTPSHAQAPAAPPSAVTQTEVIIDGKGWGHGVGMAQDGAHALGVAGKSAAEILATFYPGTEMGEGSGTLNVSIDGPQPAVELAFPDGGEVLDALDGEQSPGFPVAIAPGGSVRLTADGGLYHAFPLGGATPAPTTPPTTAAPPTTIAPMLGLPPATTVPPPAPPPPTEPTSGRSLWAVPPDGSVVGVVATGREYRGVLEASGGEGSLQLINQVDVEQYLRGMGEIRDPSWPAASLQTQAIAARTYALRSEGGVLCSTDQCQVYLGATVEYGAMDAAVAATSGQVLRYRGSLANTYYSANAGGFTATSEEGFGSGDLPYLQAVPYPTLNPDPWTMRATLADVAGRFGYANATGVRVSRAGPSGRPLEIIFDGDRGPVAVEGLRFQSVLSLRSNLYTVRIEEPPPPPPPPPPAGQAAAPLGGQQVKVSPPPEMASFTRPPPLNRRPWIALALLMLVVSTSAATRVRAAAGVRPVGGG